MQIKPESGCDALTVARLKLSYCTKKGLFFTKIFKMCKHLHEHCMTDRKIDVWKFLNESLTQGSAHYEAILRTYYHYVDKCMVKKKIKFIDLDKPFK